ncbi:DnaA ATPase domain-containing protein [Streptomyces sp. ME19-01-6]|uniref:DnaA ATPase domain-containing protein n=1 Tax=Streptomyces sp. ME19-01-6 TaxID=3028686 RepID=UPI0029B251BB|nr:DnaA/Hda family protein [Streptomyces sp. ME19-01-6]MDX3230560.1 DnaA/Hda family protein [Streptomyces sp. ME19-01-6]
MHSSSDDISPRQSFLQERRDRAVNAFSARIPSLYQVEIELAPSAYRWATGTADCPSLFLAGAIGVGKTHNAWQAIRLWVHNWHTASTRQSSPSIETWRSTALFDALRPDSGGGAPQSLIKTLQRADLLYIDDLAAARVSPTGWTQERLYEIFDERYINRRPVLITCDVMPNKISHIVGDRVSSRLAEMCRGGAFRLSGADRRRGVAA